jgi:putative copper export protein
MLSPTSTTIRLFLHVLAATVWVGGQLTLAGLVPGLRQLSPDAPRTVARRFNRIAWPAFAVLVITGMWNVLAIDVTSTSSAFQVTVFAHIAVAAVSGLSAALHAGARTKLGLALGGAISAISAIGAVFLGVLLRSA